MTWTAASEVLADWIGDDAPTETAKVASWIGKAERLLRSEVPSLATRLAVTPVTEPDLLGNVKDVVTEMVQEVFRNPERIRQRQEGTGPFTGSVTFGGDTPGELRVTAKQIKLLSPASDSTGAFTIDMIPSHSRFSGAYSPALNGWETA
jgi:hypothetical protein